MAKQREAGWSLDKKEEDQSWSDYWGQIEKGRGNPYAPTGDESRVVLGDEEAGWKYRSDATLQKQIAALRKKGKTNQANKAQSYLDELDKAKLYIQGKHDNKKLDFYEPSPAVEEMYQKWEVDQDGHKNKVFNQMSDKGKKWLFKGTSKQKQEAKQYKFDIETWEANKQKLRNEYGKLVEKIDNDVANEQLMANYKDSMNLNNYNRALEEWELENTMKDQVFAKSEEIYNRQLDSNRDAAEFSAISLLRKQRELEMEQAYKKREESLEALKAEGAAVNSGASGNIQNAMYVDIAQQRGRSAAMMAQSLMSAQTETQYGLQGILKDRYNADMQAWSQRQLEPLYAPPPVIPDPTPISQFVYPEAPGWEDFGPKPILGQVNTYQPPVIEQPQQNKGIIGSFVDWLF